MLLDKLKPNRTVAINHKGRDFFVGDIHGQYQQLFLQLDHVNFNFEKDRLFSTGDLIDRGPDSIQCIELLKKPWFFAVLGNHESLFLQGFTHKDCWHILRKNGGEWIFEEQRSHSALLNLAHLIRIKMPFSLSIQSVNGLIGLSHADAPNYWSRVQNTQLTDEDIFTLLWNRVDFLSKTKKPIEEVYQTVHGHSSVATPHVINNQIWIDTFQHTKKLSVIAATELANLIRRSKHD